MFKRPVMEGMERNGAEYTIPGDTDWDHIKKAIAVPITMLSNYLSNKS